MSQFNNLAHNLRSLLGALEINRALPIYRDTITICDFLENSLYRIAVFAPFNHGKSTLLNALLGSKTLPIDLIPTTGTAIRVSYGEKLSTVINLKDGTKIQEAGIKILQQYAILDSDRKMNDEVEEVVIFYNHPWLKTGVEFLDLPGTNDREAQNSLVREKLLSADLILHVLDARKLMTLEEREHLKHWLQTRGITSVIFVVNFLNLLTPQEQQQVKNRLHSVAASFRSSLPADISNIYCVDALPALRAKLSNTIDARTTGIVTLESALQKIVSANQAIANKLPRAIDISLKLIEQAKSKTKEIESEITLEQEQLNHQIKIKHKAAKLIEEGLERSISEFKSWLYLPQLLANYQPSLAIALQQTRFDEWLELEFKPEIFKQQQAINKWTQQARDFFQNRDCVWLTIDCSSLPTIEMPTSDSIEENNSTYKSYLPQELNFLKRKKAGAVVLGGANYLIGKLANKSPTTDESSDRTAPISALTYVNAAENYLKKFSEDANQKINTYEPKARDYITYIPAIEQNQSSHNHYRLQLLNNLIDNLQHEINLIQTC